VEEFPLIKTVYIGLALHRAHLFAIGVAIWLWSKGRMRGWQAAALVTVSLVAQQVHTADLSSTAGAGLLVIAIAAAAGGPDWNGALMAPFARLVHWLAGISYGVFLLNQELGFVVMRGVHHLGGGPVVQIAAMFGAAVLFGWLLTRLVERPAYRLLTGRQGAKRQAQGGSAGRAPSRPVPEPRPVSQPSSSLPSPRTDSTAVFSSLALTTQLR
jgi:peptidoglycan/LPS O-acetylase OafA/YrhL